MTPVNPSAPSDAYLGFLRRLDDVRRLGVQLGLDRVRAALDRLGNPQKKFASVHIAGTNGKGSTAAMTESILRGAGFRTGLYTSPHLCRFTERIRIDGAEVSGLQLARLDAHVKATGVPLTYFEIATLLAFMAFAEAGVEVAVVETGLGGRLDATNTCVAVATAITSIAFDHTDVLGHSLGGIAGEKGGIAKTGIPMYCGDLLPEAWEVIKACCARVAAPVQRVGHEIALPTGDVALVGQHQRKNAALAVALAGEAARVLGRPVTPPVVMAGLARVAWPGRLEQVRPGIWLDGAHNAEGASALAESLASIRPHTLITSVVNGKDTAGIFGPLVPHFGRVIATQSGNERAQRPGDLVAILVKSGFSRDCVSQAPHVSAALAQAGADLPLVVAGSLFLVGEARAQLLGEPIDPVGGDPLP